MATDNRYLKAHVIQIFVKTLTEKTITLDINAANDTISDVKYKIQDREGIPPNMQMLTYRGKKLESNHTIKQSKLSAFCTIDLSLKLLSSQTVISLKLPGHNEKDIKIPFTPFTTLYDIKQHLERISQKHEIPNIKYFVHNDNILRDSTLNIAQIDELYNDLTIHTKFGEPFVEALYTEYKLLHNGKTIIFSKSKSNMNMNIADGIHGFLRKTNIDPLFYSGYCPFKHIIITYNNTKLKLRMTDSAEYAQPFGAPYSSLQKCRTEEFGLLPNTELSAMAQYFPVCDCCEKEKIDEMCIDSMNADIVASDRTSDELNDDLNENIIKINVFISDESFILHNKFYYINGVFYRKHNLIQNHKIDLELYPILGAPQKLNEEILICGYIRYLSICYQQQIPSDIIKVIVLLYPSMYGGKYDVDEHNKDLCNKLQQKTNVFMIDDICFYLKFGSQNEGDDDDEEYIYENGSYFLVLDFSKQKQISVLVILCCVYCKISFESHSFIRSITVDDTVNNIEHIALPDFDITSSLSSLICDVQIVNSLKYGVVYQYPMLLRQNAYLLEWKIDVELMNKFKECVGNDKNQSFESNIFYNLFKLRCYPNEKKRLLLSIQLISLPINRPNKDKISGLSTKCTIYETETSTQIPSFDAVFDYTQDNSAFATILMNSQKVLDKKTLRFRAEIMIIDPDNDDIPSLNLHYGNQNRARRRRGRGQ